MVINPYVVVQQVISTVGESVTGAFGQLDEYLESVKVLPVLEKPPQKSDFMTAEWEEV